MSMLAALLLVLGTLFTLFASLGILRMPDLYTRMHAATKAGTAGLSLLLLAVALCMPEIGVISRLVGIMLFIFLTAPVAAHLLGKVTQQAGYAFWRNQDAAKQKRRRSSLLPIHLFQPVMALPLLLITHPFESPSASRIVLHETGVTNPLGKV